MEACRKGNEVEKNSDVLYFDRNICDALFDAKTKFKKKCGLCFGEYIDSCLCKKCIGFMHEIGDCDSRSE
jgi:peptide methionine sulfoxide reductase MsrB